MAPGLTNDNSPMLAAAAGEHVKAEKQHNVLLTDTAPLQYPKPLELTGALDGFRYEDTTAVIGREYFDVNIVRDILSPANSDEILRDLAITIAQRGAVFFRSQDNLTDDLQKDFIQRLGICSGKPPTSTLHPHPLINLSRLPPDPAVSTVSSVERRNRYTGAASSIKPTKRRYDSATWHSDIQFEPYAADFTSLRLLQLPRTGGDTLFASGYEIYDRFSKPYQTMFEGLTATFAADGFIKLAEANPGKLALHEGPRGSPYNVGRELRAVHPVVRTNPLTGWKSIFPLGLFPVCINELTPTESEELLERFYRVITENHDLQARFKWRGANDIAIWDNRSAFHAATFDYDGLGDRFGHRVVGIGEAPFFDPNSKSRTEDLASRGVCI